LTGLKALFEPRTIAVVGASNDLTRIRGRVLANVRNAQFPGRIYPVNPSATEIQGLRAYASVRALPEPIDLAIIALSAGQVLGALEECAAVGTRSAIVFASGFAEGGDAAAQARITELARRTGMRILGPNTVGFDNSALGIAATFSPITTERLKSARLTDPAEASVDIVCQSGGLGFALASQALARGIAVRNTITTGNEADCETLEIVEYLLGASGSRAILLFVEGFREASRLAPVAALAAARQVPLVVAKLGRSAAGQRAAVSHTSHLTGSDVVCDAQFERHGLLRVEDPEEMLALAAALTRLPAMRGNKVAIVTTSGGSGGWAADILTAQGLRVGEPSSDLQQRLAQLMPGFGSASNPIDVTASVVEDGGVGMAKVIQSIAASSEFDAILVILSLVAPGRIATMRELLGPILDAKPLPIIFHSPGLPSSDNLEQLRELNGLQLSLREAALALRGLWRHGAHGQRRAAAGPEASGGAVTRSEAGSVAAKLLAATGSSGRDAATAVLAAYGIGTPPERLVHSAAGASAAGEALGFPVVLKIDSPDIAHKSDVGGVALDVGNGAACAAAYARILDTVQRSCPTAALRGIVVQKHMPPGLEMIVGMTVDADFGPMLLLGFGGIFVEIFKDSVIAPLPVTPGEALKMVESLKGAALLKGARNQPARDVPALVKLLVGLSALIGDAGDAIAEAEFNPVLVYAQGAGVSVVDYLFVPRIEARSA